MNKQIDKLKKQLIDITEVVNSFKSEAVQVKIIDRMLDLMLEGEKPEAESEDLTLKKGRKLKFDEEGRLSTGRKKPGATRVLSQLLVTTPFFETSRSISAIADYCKANYDSDFKTSELSGILLKLANENKLRRERSHENNRFEYIKA